VTSTEELRGYSATHLGRQKAHSYDADLWTTSSAKGLTWMVEQLLLDRIFASLPAPPATALDFACGTGRVLKYLLDRGIDATGVDISPDMLELASDRCSRATLVQGDVIAQPELVPGPFDVATAFRFFLNAEPELRVDVARWLRGVVRPGGHLVANFHLNPVSARGLYTRARMRGDAAMPMMTIAQATDLVRAGGFEPISVHGYDVLPFRRDGNPLALPRLRSWAERHLFDRRGIERVAATFIVVARRCP
jgi:SAM-dependent methyltransferase